jgi:hypothetical protein
MHTLRFYFLLYKKLRFSRDDFYAAQNATRKTLGEIGILDSSGNVERVIPFTEADRKL